MCLRRVAVCCGRAGTGLPSAGTPHPVRGHGAPFLVPRRPPALGVPLSGHQPLPFAQWLNQGTFTCPRQPTAPPPPPSALSEGWFCVDLPPPLGKTPRKVGKMPKIVFFSGVAYFPQRDNDMRKNMHFPAQSAEKEKNWVPGVPQPLPAHPGQSRTPVPPPRKNFRKLRKILA